MILLRYNFPAGCSSRLLPPSSFEYRRRTHACRAEGVAIADPAHIPRREKAQASLPKTYSVCLLGAVSFRDTSGEVVLTEAANAGYVVSPMGDFLQDSCC